MPLILRTFFSRSVTHHFSELSQMRSVSCISVRYDVNVLQRTGSVMDMENVPRAVWGCGGDAGGCAASIGGVARGSGGSCAGRGAAAPRPSIRTPSGNAWRWASPPPASPARWESHAAPCTRPKKPPHRQTQRPDRSSPPPRVHVLFFQMSRSAASGR